MPKVGSQVRVYPRVCGGTTAPRWTPMPPQGLSPRVRGNPVVSSPRVRRRGSIPACAGEPMRATPPTGRRKVYPRVCGGTAALAAGGVAGAGLSPRVRGNPGLRILTAYPPRSIPACAGEPPPCRRTRCCLWVYPRVCGGTRSELLIPWKSLGLSPRVRGNHRQNVQPRLRRGSIPACAGEPRTQRAVPRQRPVYPRVCGGTASSKLSSSIRRGLSPRVRGNPGKGGIGQVGIGSIPACAGEPCPPLSLHPGAAVYPRVCGGTGADVDVQHTGRGLSPRVRGNRHRRNIHPQAPGSIPACAGEPWPAGR